MDGGSGVQLVKRVNEKFQKEIGEPTFAPDGKHIYFTRNITPGGVFQYAQDSNGALFAIDQYELDTGDVRRVTAGNGGAVRPNPLPRARISLISEQRRASRDAWRRAALPTMQSSVAGTGPHAEPPHPFFERTCPP